MTTIATSLEGLIRSLSPLSETPQLDAQVLLEHTLNQSRSWLIAHHESQLNPTTIARLDSYLHRLEGGEPLPYILGKWEFFSLPFEVTPAVLIPRPETELLVEQAISWLRNRRDGNEGWIALDAGTGSGCIAIALAVHLPKLQVIATDISRSALEVAHRNAMRLCVDDRVTFIETDLFPGEDQQSPWKESDASPIVQIPSKYDLIVGNLPYIPTATLLGLPISSHEPRLALDGGSSGLAVIHRMLAKGPRLLANGGLMLLEIEASEGLAVLSMAAVAFPGAEIILHKDLAGHDRLIEIQQVFPHEVTPPNRR